MQYAGREINEIRGYQQLQIAEVQAQRKRALNTGRHLHCRFPPITSEVQLLPTRRSNTRGMACRLYPDYRSPKA